MGSRKTELSHEQVWDDAALIDSWNDALAEYKKYHSLYTKGGTLRDLTEAQQSIAGIPDATELASSKDEGEPQEEPISGTSEVEQSRASTGAPLQPQALLGSMKDENLKNLLMSWYYAGYYTGLHEGQQQAEASKS